MTNNYVLCNNKKAWIMFDLSNVSNTKGYCWVFSTKAEAMRHRKIQSKKKNCADLSLPIKVQVGK